MNLCRTAGRMTALVLAALVLVGLPAMALPAFAAGKLATPAGPVILTVHGRIANTNRGALDAFDDAFFKSSGAAFDRAAALDGKSVVEGRGGAGRVDRGGSRVNQKKSKHRESTL